MCNLYMPIVLQILNETYLLYVHCKWIFNSHDQVHNGGITGSRSEGMML